MTSNSKWFAGGMLCLFGLFLLVLGGWLAAEHQWLQRRGVEVTAEVLRTFSQGRGSRETFGAMLRPADQPAMELKVRLTREQHQQLSEGDQLPFAYLPEHPSIYVLGGLSQVRALGARDAGSIGGGLALLVAGLALLPKRKRVRRR